MKKTKTEISSIAPFLRQYAAKKAIDTAEFAYEINTTYEYARRLLAGHSIPSPGKLVEIGQLLGIGADKMKTLKKMVFDDRLLHDSRRADYVKP